MLALDEQIGRSARGRPLIVRHRRGKSAEAARVFILAGQHGDEPLARAAVASFFREHSFSDVQIAALMDANPDGAHWGQRRNANGVDLNRDHQRLAAPETQAVHAFARRWKPHLIVDVHTYPPRRKHLLARGLVHANDVFIDVANNPAACAGASWAPWLNEMLPRWVDGVRAGGFRCDRYTIVTRGGRVRHSTPDVVDARNGLALGCGAPTVLLEGREPTQFDDDKAAKRTVKALVVALQSIVASVRGAALSDAHRVPQAKIAIPIRSRYADGVDGRELEFFDRRHTTVRRVRLPGAYSPQLTVTQRAVAPLAYAVPVDCVELLNLLLHHGLQARKWIEWDQLHARHFRVRHVEPSPHALRPPRRLRTNIVPFPGCGDGHVVLDVTDDNARLLALFLEPHSKYGLSRYGELGLYPQVGSPYPIVRLEVDAVSACAAASVR